MAITNPDKVVTKQDLADFYGEIFPYLGGMPEIVANKFSKSDIYSTTEKMIGQWHDGKPIYQKVFTGTTPASSPNNTRLLEAVDVFDGSIGANVGNFIKFDAFVQLASGRYYQLGEVSKTTVTNLWFTGWVTDNTHVSTPNQIKLAVGSDSTLASRPYYVILQYTKTTDSATSIGVDTDYSTTEKIVGTWIDGKPVYQKTIPITLPTCTTDGTEVSASFAIGASIDVAVDAKVLYLQDGKWTVLFANNGSTSRFIRFLVQTNEFSTVADRNKIRIGNAAKSASGCTGYATIQYTKTT